MTDSEVIGFIVGFSSNSTEDAFVVAFDETPNSDAEFGTSAELEDGVSGNTGAW